MVIKRTSCTCVQFDSNTDRCELSRSITLQMKPGMEVEVMARFRSDDSSTLPTSICSSTAISVMFRDGKIVNIRTQRKLNIDSIEVLVTTNMGIHLEQC